jgi:glycosyltransferase involved in cell wall biosynthesis
VLFSDVDSSQMLEKIITDLSESELSIKVIAIGNPKMKLASALGRVNIKVKVIRKRRKHLLPLMLFPIAKEFLYFRPSIFFASGQYATFFGMCLAFLFQTPSRIFIRHHTNSNSRFNLMSGIWVDKISNRAATKIVAVSKIVQTTLIEDERVALEKVIVIPNGIDVAHFSQNRNQSFKDDLFECQTFKVGVISRITPVKGVKYIAEAFVEFNAIHPNSHLEIIGAFADSYNEVLEILGHLSQDSYTLSETTNSVQQFLSSVDVFVHTPIGPVEEAFGLVYVESLASGIPTIFSVSGILHDIFELDRFTHLVPYKNPEAILQELLAIREVNYQKKELVPENMLKRFSIEKMSNSYLKLLRG